MAAQPAEDRGGAASAGRTAATALALFCLVMAPALLLGNLHWDAWIHHVVMLDGRDRWIVDEFVNNGRPVNGHLMLAAFGLLGLGHGTLWASWLCLAVATGAVAHAGLRSGLLGPREAVLVALFTGLNPAHQMMLSSSSLHFFAALAAFAAGLALSVEAQRRSAGPGRWAAEAGALALLAFGAATGDSVAFLLPAVAWIRWAMWAREAGLAGPAGPLATARALWRAAPARTLALAAPAVAAGLAFVAHFLAFTPSADFEAERSVVIGPLMTLEFMARFAVSVALCYPLVWLAMLTQSRAPRPGWPAPGRWSALAWFALLCAVLALLPYWLADRKPTVTGWSVRFLFTLGPALGLACVLWLRRLSPPDQARAALLLGAALALCLGARWPLWLDRQAKDDAVLAAARVAALPGGAQTVCVYDMNPAVARPYRDFEWTGMWMTATGRRDLLALQPSGLDTLEQQIAQQAQLLRVRYPMLTTSPPAHCSAEMLLPEPRASWPVTVAANTLLRWVWPRERHEAWLLARYPASARPLVAR